MKFLSPSWGLISRPAFERAADGEASRLVRTCRTAPEYRLYALTGTTPPKPGLERLVREPGHAIEVEVWALPVEAFGGFVALIPAAPRNGNPAS